MGFQTLWSKTFCLSLCCIIEIIVDNQGFIQWPMVGLEIKHSHQIIELDLIHYMCYYVKQAYIILSIFNLK